MQEIPCRWECSFPFGYPSVVRSRLTMLAITSVQLACSAAIPVPPTAQQGPAPGPVTTDACAELFPDLDCGPTAEISRRERAEPGGAVCEVMCVSAGTPHGPARTLVRGSPPIWTAGEHFQGRKTGEWTTRAGGPHGPITDVTNYLHGPRHGPYRTFHPGGRPHVTGGYHRDLPDGRWTTQSPDGVVLVDESFVRGVLVGQRTTRHPDGQVATRSNHGPDGRPEGRWCAWSARGDELGCTDFVDGTGVARDFGDHGVLVRETPYVDGLRHGVEVAYGERRREVPWQHGHMTGQEREIAQGCVVIERTLVDGQPHGPYVERACQTGGDVITRQGEYCSGHYCGVWIERDARGGAIRQITEYDNLSMKLAEATFQDGRLSDFWTFDESMRVRRAACYQALASGLCCDVTLDYRITGQCDAADDVATTEL